MAWDRSILTDSGGFQVFSLSDLRKVTEEGVSFRSHLDGSSHFFTPESAMAAQIGLGADIIMAFDECTELPAERPGTVVYGDDAALGRARSKQYSKRTNTRFPGLPSDMSKSQTLFGIVQGGMYPDLRKESAERTVEIGFPGYALGGFSVGEPREQTAEWLRTRFPSFRRTSPAT